MPLQLCRGRRARASSSPCFPKRRRRFGGDFVEVDRLESVVFRRSASAFCGAMFLQFWPVQLCMSHQHVGVAFVRCPAQWFGQDICRDEVSGEVGRLHDPFLLLVPDMVIPERQMARPGVEVPRLYDGQRALVVLRDGDWFRHCYAEVMS